MERMKAQDFPQELLNIFDRYVHGDIGRREFLDDAKKVAVIGLTLLRWTPSVGQKLVHS